MKRATSLLAALALVAGSATLGAQPIDTPTDDVMDDSAAGATMTYPVDTDRDGRTDGELVLEHSDSLA